MQVQSRPSFWVGVRFNPYKWPEAQFADEAGHAMFAAGKVPAACRA